MATALDKSLDDVSFSVFCVFPTRCSDGQPDANRSSLLDQGLVADVRTVVRVPQMVLRKWVVLWARLARAMLMLYQLPTAIAPLLSPLSPRLNPMPPKSSPPTLLRT